MKKVRMECREYELPYIVLLTIYLVVIVAFYTILFEVPTHRAYYEASFLSSKPVNLTRLSEFLDGHKISSYRIDNGMKISFVGGFINGSYLHPVDGEVRIYNGDYGKTYIYVDLWLNRTQFPAKSFHDAIETMPILYDTGRYVRNAMASYSDFKLLSESNSTATWGGRYD